MTGSEGRGNGREFDVCRCGDGFDVGARPCGKTSSEARSAVSLPRGACRLSTLEDVDGRLALWGGLSMGRIGSGDGPSEGRRRGSRCWSKEMGCQCRGRGGGAGSKSLEATLVDDV